MIALRAPSPVRTDVAFAALSALLIGAGATVAAATAGRGDYAVALGGAAVAAMGLILMVAARWVDGLTIVALAIPLPAIISTADLRVAAAAPITAAVIAAWFISPMPLRVSPGLRQVRNATLLLFGVMTVATLLAASPATSLRELINMAVLLAFFLFALVHATDARAGERTLRMLVVLAACCGGLAVLEMTGVLPGQFPR